MICIGLLQIISRMMDQENESRQIAGYNNQIILFRLEIPGSTDGFFYFPDLLVFSTGIAGIRLIQKPAVEIGSLPLHMSTMQISNQMKTKMSWQTFSVAINQGILLNTGYIFRRKAFSNATSTYAILILMMQCNVASANGCCGSGQSGCTSGCFLGIGSCPGAYCNTCSNCNPGTWGDGCNCNTCAAGTYSGTGAPVCSTCPAGSYSASGSAQCSPCKICDPHAITTTACIAGSSVDTVECTCNAGYWGNGLKCLLCTVCDINAVTPGTCAAAATKDMQCECKAGYSGNGQSCTVCPAATWQSSAQTGNGCTNVCPAGTWGNTTRATSESEACPYSCPPGTWGTAIQSRSQGQACPFSCSPGSWAAVRGSTSPCGNLCPAGTWGTYAGATSVSQACPYACPAGSWGATNGSGSLGAACPLVFVLRVRGVLRQDQPLPYRRALPLAPQLHGGMLLARLLLARRARITALLGAGGIQRGPLP